MVILFSQSKVHASSSRTAEMQKKKGSISMQQRTRLNQSQSMKMPPSLEQA